MTTEVKIPKHLKAYIVDQNYDKYTFKDHAIWRFVMKQNLNNLKDKAHEAYLQGLKCTGVNIERIPKVEEMNRLLEKMGWHAVTVDGFLPPQVFMEFQANKILVITSMIRPLEQIAYTPAPDILHEVAGHLPIIANPEYAEYLRRFGEVGRRAFSNNIDQEIYEAIRHLSILKTEDSQNSAEIDRLENLISELSMNNQGLSEMAQLRNLHWWTVEYGLIGSLEEPKIYGAGLLSSIAESKNALCDNVAKLEFNLNAKDVSFDITNLQPQLFVTPNFEFLNSVLDEFEADMAFRKGGVEALVKAIDSNSHSTIVLDSGIQISGILSYFSLSEDDKPAYVKFSGPTQLAYSDTQIAKHGCEYHRDGFGSPIGFLKNSEKCLSVLNAEELARLGIEIGKRSNLEFESGITLQGTLIDIVRVKEKNIILSFSNCDVNINGEVLFAKEWGNFDLAVGTSVVSAFCGVADLDNFQFDVDSEAYKTNNQTHYVDPELDELYKQVRAIREEEAKFERLLPLAEKAMDKYPNEWLLFYSINELLDYNLHSEFKEKLELFISEVTKSDQKLTEVFAI